GYNAGFRDDFYVSAELENAEVCLPLDSVVNVTCKVQLPEALISGKNKPKYVDEITLQSFFLNEKELIKQTYPNGVTNAEDEYFPWETLLEINGGDLYLSNVYVKLSNSFNFGFSKFFIKDMEMIDEKTYKFECICEDFYHPDSKYKIEKEAIAMLYAEIDGDYIKVFLFDIENLFKIYARINKETEHELNSYFETGLCDLSKVTWPRHADGTCDYDNANDNETASTSGNPDTSAEAAVSKPAPAVGKTATVTENLRLRTDDKATAEVVTTLAAGTRVKVEAIGKEETIDGITSNWVQVSVFDGAKDKDGNAIEAGTVGWLFGGYLFETESAASESANEEASTAKESSALPIVPIAVGGAALAVLLAVVLLVVAKKKKVYKD
ncbi:MAG: SH3 domain-containing protein, partial [Treponemataceae bacterium]|nr:SH3 domain-containing protein [Treponemataceae bacterium]